MNSSLKVIDFIHSAPILFMAGWACLVLLADALGKSKSGKMWPLAIMGLLAGIALTVVSWITHPHPQHGVFGGMLLIDRYGLFFDLMFMAAGLLTLLLSGPYLKEHRIAFGEYHTLILLIITGMMVLIHAGDFVVLLIGLETMSLGVYALVASWTSNPKSAEAGLKYFIMGAVASAFLIFGVSLIYGATGHTNFHSVSQVAAQMEGNRLFLVGMFMIMGAMAFKVALVPFHAWTPDVYEGAPTTVTGFMAAAVKAAGIGVLLRVFTLCFGSGTYVFGFNGWSDIFEWLAILTMIVGNLAALRQTNIKRMLAYSSVAHAGYIMIGVITAGVLPDQKGAPVLFYLLSYTFTTMGAFGIIAWLGNRGRERTDLDDWNGIAGRHPVAAAAMTLFMLSLAGVPPTAGFFAKFYLFRAALEHPGLLPLIIVAVLSSAVSFYYYLKPVVAMYFKKAPEDQEPPKPIRSGAMITALVIAATFVLMLGLAPHNYLTWATQSVMSILGN